MPLIGFLGGFSCFLSVGEQIFMVMLAFPLPHRLQRVYLPGYLSTRHYWLLLELVGLGLPSKTTSLPYLILNHCLPRLWIQRHLQLLKRLGVIVELLNYLKSRSWRFLDIEHHKALRLHSGSFPGRNYLADSVVVAFFKRASCAVVFILCR